MKPTSHFARVNTKVTRVFKLRLKFACEEREHETARRVPEGEILSELVKYLEPHPDEAKGTASSTSKKSPKREAKKATPKPTAIAAA